MRTQRREQRSQVYAGWQGQISWEKQLLSGRLTAKSVVTKQKRRSDGGYKGLMIKARHSSSEANRKQETFRGESGGQKGPRLGAEELERRGAAFDTVFGHEHASHFGRVELQAEVESEEARAKTAQDEEGKGKSQRSRRPLCMLTTATSGCHDTRNISSNSDEDGRERDTGNSLDIATAAAFNLTEPRQRSEVDRPAAQLGQVACPCQEPVSMPSSVERESSRDYPRTFVGVAVQFLRIGNKEMSRKDRIVRVCRFWQGTHVGEQSACMRGTFENLRMRDV